LQQHQQRSQTLSEQQQMPQTSSKDELQQVRWGSSHQQVSLQQVSPEVSQLQEMESDLSQQQVSHALSDQVLQISSQLQRVHWGAPQQQ